MAVVLALAFVAACTDSMQTPTGPDALTAPVFVTDQHEGVAHHHFTHLNGDNEVPVRDTRAQGQELFTLSDDDRTASRSSADSKTPVSVAIAHTRILRLPLVAFNRTSSHRMTDHVATTIVRTLPRHAGGCTGVRHGAFPRGRTPRPHRHGLVDARIGGHARPRANHPEDVHVRDAAVTTWLHLAMSPIDGPDADREVFEQRRESIAHGFHTDAETMTTETQNAPTKTQANSLKRAIGEGVHGSGPPSRLRRYGGQPSHALA